MINKLNYLIFNTVSIIALIAISNQLNAQCDLSIDVPEDITICNPELIDLIGDIGGSYLSFEWSGTNGFSDDQLITSDFTTNNTTYTLSAYGETSNNLVVNADFSAGNTGFTTDYLLGEDFCPSNPIGVLQCEGMYTINTNAANTHTGFQPCTDHTTGSGNMMIVNGSSNAVDIWCQDITVIPGTNYLFSAWATSVVASSPAILQFSINGTLIGSDFNLTATTCLWENFTAIWNSGSNTTATICITNQNLATGGNDFALDDIEFNELCEDQASFDVTISEVLGTLPTSNSLNCDNPLIDLSVSPSDANYTYEWQAQFGGTIEGSTTSSSVIGSSSGLYSVTITDSNGCTKKLTSTINGSTEPPVASVFGDFTITCNNSEVIIFSTNNDSGNTYFWQGSADNSQIGFAVYDTPGIYYLEITNSFNCTTVVPFQISNNSITPSYDLPPPEELTCTGDSAELVFSAMFPPNDITWFDPNGNPLSQSDTVYVDEIGYYLIKMEYSNGCTFYDSVQVSSQGSNLDYTLGESPTISCANSIDSITVAVNSPFSEIIWYQDSILGNESSLQIEEAGLYQIDIVSLKGCITSDSILVLEDFELNLYDLATDTIDCIDGEGVVFVSSDSLITVTWELPSGSTSTNDTIESSTAGIYYIEITHDNGCVESDSIELFASQNFPNISIAFDSISCNSPTANIEIESNIANTTFVWVGPNGFDSDAKNLTVDEAGYYIYTATTQNGCSSIDSVLISADLQEPVFSLSSDTINCENTSAIVTVNSNNGITIQDVQGAGVLDITDLSISVDQASNYTVIVEGTNGCTSESSIEVPSNFTAPDMLGLADITLNCFTPDTALQINNQPNVEIYWTSGTDTIWSNVIDLDDTSTDFELHLVDSSTGCITSEDVSITQDFTIYPINVTNTNINCLNTEATIAIDVADPYLEIIGVDELTQQTDTEFTTSSILSGNITVIFENGCANSQAFNIDIDTITPIISAEDRVFSCIKEPLALFVDVNINDLVYDWSGPQGMMSNEDFLVTAIPGLYYVTVTDPTNGCSSSTEIEVFEFLNNLAYDVNLEHPLCYGDLGAADIINISGWTEPYQVEIFNTANEDVDANNLDPGSYNVIIQDDVGCDSSFTINIIEPFLINLELVSELTISTGTDLQLEAFTNLDLEDIASIQWDPSSYLSCSDCLNPLVSGLSEDTEFTITIIDNYGCSSTQTVIVRIIVEFKIYTPNIFSPDGDGVNEVFFLSSNNFAAESTIEEFAIFDRWGNKVFQKNDILPNDSSPGWDGSFNGKTVKAGVYVWYAKIVLPDGSEELLQGDVTVKR